MAGKGKDKWGGWLDYKWKLRSEGRASSEKNQDHVVKDERV